MRRMRPLSEKQYRIEAEPTFRKVFARDYPFDAPIASHVHRRSLLHPVTYELDYIQLHAVASAAQVVGDDAFYFSVLERPSEEEQKEYYHWLIPLEDLNSYYRLGKDAPVFILENALYSPTGKWGLMLSHESFALAAGSSIFIETLYTYLPNSEDEQVRAFLQGWKADHDRFGLRIDWIPGLLKHLYGAEKARGLLAEAGMV